MRRQLLLARIRRTQVRESVGALTLLALLLQALRAHGIHAGWPRQSLPRRLQRMDL